MKSIITTIILYLVFTIKLCAQKINADSLLLKTLHEINTLKNYPSATQLAHTGIKEAPEYLDFYLALGRIYQLTAKNDSARYYFNYIINKTHTYKEAYIYLANIEIEEKNSPGAIHTIDQALKFYPDEKELYLLKLQAVSLENNEEKTRSFLYFLTQKYPDEERLKQQLIQLKTNAASNRIGLNYNHTLFSRDGIGPWHIIGLQYIREQKKLTLIGQINYADRHAWGNSVNSGLQYEFETYFLNTKSSYAYGNLAYSRHRVFPKLRLAYSHFYSFNKGWEVDLGARYTQTADKKLLSTVLGIGKYVGSCWLNFKSYLHTDESRLYPAFAVTTRYYYNTKYDYAAIIAGYGTSPDERVTLGLFQQRVSLNSYRIGIGVYKLTLQRYWLGSQIMYNCQEYTLNKFQNEFDLSLSIHYKF